MSASMQLCWYGSIWVCEYVSMQVCTQVCMYVCRYVSKYVCVYMYIYAHMCTYVYIYIARERGAQKITLSHCTSSSSPAPACTLRATCTTRACTCPAGLTLSKVPPLTILQSTGSRTGHGPGLHRCFIQNFTALLLTASVPVSVVNGESQSTFTSPRGQDLLSPSLIHQPGRRYKFRYTYIRIYRYRCKYRYRHGYGCAYILYGYGCAYVCMYVCMYIDR